MHTRLIHSLALCGALSLIACSGDSSEQGEDAGWCVDDQECEGDASASRDAGADTDPGDESDAGADLGDDPDVGDDTGEDVGEDDAGEARPARIDPPKNLGEVRDLAVHKGTGCALEGAKVVCWGDNTHGQAQPPTDDLWAERVLLTERYGCVVGPSTGIVCWGDGVGEVAEADGVRLIGRFTQYGASANSEVLCQSSAYVEPSTRISCYDEATSWQIGPEGAIAVDVQYDTNYGGYPTVCYAVARGDGYAYECMHGESVISVTTTAGEWKGIEPTIRHDGDGQVAVLLADGDVAWYDLALIDRAAPGPREATPWPVEWGTWRAGFDASRDSVELLSPNCLRHSNYPILCRKSDYTTIDFVARQSSPFAAVHEHEDQISYCFSSGYADADGDTGPACETVRR